MSRNESQGEHLTRQILERLFTKPFNKVRPAFLLNPETGRSLELDCYNEELKLAVEYNGLQHYKIVRHYHSDLHDYIEQLQRDETKIRLCQEAGVHLLIIPASVPHQQLEIYIRVHLSRFFEIKGQSRVEKEIAVINEDQLDLRSIENRQIFLIRKICQKLGLRNSLDVTSYILYQRINDIWFLEQADLIILTFKLPFQEEAIRKEGLKGIITLVDQTFKVWSGARLARLEKPFGSEAQVQRGFKLILPAI